ncbi:hypothetical protein EBR96_10535, partial [bacterium]|nr:hypothetical protein [bacterium]
VAVAAGVVAVAVVAANPVGAALLGAGALVGVGYAVYKHVRAKRHAAKVETQHQQMNKTQQFFKSRIDRIDKEMKVSGADKGTILQREGFKTEAHFARLQKLSTSATFVLDASTLDSQDMNLVHQGCQSEIGAAKRAMATMTLNDHLSRSTEPDTTYNMLEARIQDYRDKMRSNPNQTLKSLGFSNHPGVGELNKAIFNQAKEELGKELAGFPDSADKIRHHVDDLMTRDERLIDDQFRQLYRDASTPEAKAEIVRYYSDVSVSQGQSGINERVLAMDSRDAASKFSAFRQFADIDNGKLQ